MMQITSHFQRSPNSGLRYTKSIIERGGINYVLNNSSGVPFGFVPGRLVVNSYDFFSSRDVFIAQTDITKDLSGQPVHVYCEADFIDIAKDLLQLVHAKTVMGINNYELISSSRGVYTYLLHADHVLGEKRFRPTALLFVEAKNVISKNRQWYIKDSNTCQFSLAVKFGQVQPANEEDLIHYLAQYDLVAELVENS